MRTNTSPRMHVVRKEEKEARLATFIAEQLAAAIATDLAGRGLTVLARSLESPVLKALAVHNQAIRAAGLKVRAIIVLSEGSSDEVSGLLAGFTARRGCDARLLDAHEQLAIGDRVAWIGDCMRREPTKRDAYEIYSAECAEMAALAHRSFDRVWLFAAAGVKDAPCLAPEVAPTAVAVEVPIAALAEGESTPTISTRH